MTSVLQLDIRKWVKDSLLREGPLTDTLSGAIGDLTASLLLNLRSPILALKLTLKPGVGKMQNCGMQKVFCGMGGVK